MKWLLLTVLLLSVTVQAKADVDDFKWKTLKEEFATPLTTDAKYVLFGGTLATIATAILRDEYGDWTQHEANKEKPLGDYSKFGDVLGQLVPNIIYTAYMFEESIFEKKDISKKRAFLMVKATAYSSLVTTVLKYSIRQKRPGSPDKNSFPSGHTTTAFAFASVVAIEHEWYWGMGAIGLASFVGYSRMNDNMHYFHDVLGGATIGAAIGTGLSLLYRKELGKDNSIIHFPTVMVQKDYQLYSYNWIF